MIATRGRALPMHCSAVLGSSSQSDQSFQSLNPFNNKICLFFIYMSMTERNGSIG